MNCRRLIAAVVLGLGSLLGTAAWAEPPIESGATTQRIANGREGAAAIPVDPEKGKWVRRGAGCLGGAALGFILPGVGNVIGCAVGAATMSVRDFFGQPDKTNNTSVPALTKEE